MLLILFLGPRSSMEGLVFRVLFPWHQDSRLAAHVDLAGIHWRLGDAAVLGPRWDGDHLASPGNFLAWSSMLESLSRNFTGKRLQVRIRHEGPCTSTVPNVKASIALPPFVRNSRIFLSMK